MLQITPVEVWVAPVEDRPGGLAAALAPLSTAGADLEFISARRVPDRPGEGLVYIAPLEGRKQIDAARRAGFREAEIGMLRVEGPDSPGLAVALAHELLAAEDVSIRDASGVAIRRHCVLYLAFDTPQVAQRAAELLLQAQV